VKEPEFVYRENTSDDPKQRKPDITKAQTMLNWGPKVPLEEGLGPMIDEFKERICKKD
jgi:UDP-glucuronate decarboxylase